MSAPRPENEPAQGQRSAESRSSDRSSRGREKGFTPRPELADPPVLGAPPQEGPLPVEPFRSVRIRPALDLAITLGIAAPTLAVGLWVEPSLARDPPPEPGTKPDVGRLDEFALGRFSTAPNVAANVLVTASVVAPLVYHAIEAGLYRRGRGRVRGRGFFVRYGTDLVVFAQAMAVNALFTQILKSSIRRARPYTYLDPDTVDPDKREDLVHFQERFDASWSFPSGHASAAFAATTAGATLLTLELLGRANWAIVTAWVGGIALAGTTAAMRTLSGKHFPSDVITGALVGTASGIAVPLAHWRPARRGDWASQRRSLPWAFTAFPQPGGAGVGMVGQFAIEGNQRGFRIVTPATDR